MHTIVLHSLRQDSLECQGEHYPVYFGEFWTAKQRQAQAIHEISYRACFKPQLPRLFIERFTQPGDIVYDPFAGRGTTAIEAALLGRAPISNDCNPLSELLTAPRLLPPTLSEVEDRLKLIPRHGGTEDGLDLSMFYQAKTEAEIRAMRSYLMDRSQTRRLDSIDQWIRMAATNRLTGHSPGFFSVYSLPPNQAVSAERQRGINAKRNQVPTYRDTHTLILKKTKDLLKNLSQEQVDNLRRAAKKAQFLTSDAASNRSIRDATVQLTVTSPPFLDVVQYAKDNWLRCWFCGLDAEKTGQSITMAKTLPKWEVFIAGVFRELYRVTRPGGFVAFEVGEVRQGQVRLEEAVLPIGINAGFQAIGVLINEQQFTKTSQCWKVKNNHQGTNSNRIVLFGKGY